MACAGAVSSTVALIPAPHQVAAKFVELLLHEGLLYDIFASTRRVFLGVTLGILVAVPVGFLLGWYRPARTFADPMINFFRALPPIALIPLVIVYFGVDEIAKLVILFYASFFSGVIVMYEGVSQITPLYIRVSQTLGASEFEIFRKVIIPLTVPHILTALRVALGVAWATLVASELIAAQRGLGAMIQNASTYFLLDIIYVGIICIGCDRPDDGHHPAADQRTSAGLAGASRAMSVPTPGRKRAQFDHVSLAFDTPRGRLTVVEDVTYDIDDGDFVAVIGPSGCGKTTMMSMLAGFQKPTTGTVLFNGRPVSGPGPERGVIFQEYGVFPWLTVKENIAFGLKLKANHVPPSERNQICEHYLGTDGPDGFRQFLSEASVRRDAATSRDRARLCRQTAVPADGRTVRRA